MPLERNQICKISWFHGGPYHQNPLEACALRTCLSAFMVLKNIFLSFKRGWNLCTCNWARDVKKYLNYNQKHFDCPPLPGWPLLIQAILTVAKLTFLSKLLLCSFLALKLHCKLKSSYLTCTMIKLSMHVRARSVLVTNARQTWAFLLKIKYLLLSHLNDPENKKSLNWKTKLRSGRIRAYIWSWLDMAPL